MVKKDFSKKNPVWMMVVLIAVFTALVTASVFALTNTISPTILSVSPINNQESLSRHTPITVTFSEGMDPSTINENTFIVMQRTTPVFGTYISRAVVGTVTYDGNTATFMPDSMLIPNQQFGNVFTVTLTTGVKDLSGNALSQDYVWSFTTGGDVFNTGATTSH